MTKRATKKTVTGQAVEWNGSEFLVDTCADKDGADHYVYDEASIVGEVRCCGEDVLTVRVFRPVVTADDLRAIVGSL